MTLYEMHGLLQDGARLIEAESPREDPGKGTGATKEEKAEAKKRIKEELANAAKRRRIRLPTKGL